MSVYRLSSSYLMDRNVFNVQRNLGITAKIQETIASGKNISVPSDDPIGLTQLLRLELDLNHDTRYEKNIDEGLGELAAVDIAITGIVDIAHRARELATRAANGTNSQAQLDSINQEVNSLIELAHQFGNTTFAGHYIFAGLQTDQPAFTRGVGDDITYDGSLSTGVFERQVQTSKNSFTTINIPGDQLLGDVAVVAGVPGGSGLLYTLTKLKYDIINQDFDAVRDDIDLIKTDQQGILTLQTDVGSRVNELEMAKDRIQARRINQVQEMAKIQEVDMPKAISDLNFQQTIYEASLGVMARIMDTSLVNFLL